MCAAAARNDPIKLIAYELGLAPSTVDQHLRSALRKLRLRSRAELVTLYSGGRRS